MAGPRMMPAGHTETDFVCTIMGTMMTPNAPIPPMGLQVRRFQGCFGNTYMKAKLQMSMMPQSEMPFSECSVKEGMMGHGAIYACDGFDFMFDINGLGSITMTATNTSYQMRCLGVEMSTGDMGEDMDNGDMN